MKLYDINNQSLTFSECQKGEVMSRMCFCFAVLLMFVGSLSLSAEMPGRIMHGIYRSSSSDTEIKIARSSYIVRGDRIEIQTGMATVCYTVFSPTSFGNAHEIFCLCDFDNTNYLRNEKKLRRW